MLFDVWVHADVSQVDTTDSTWTPAILTLPTVFCKVHTRNTRLFSSLYPWTQDLFDPLITCILFPLISYKRTLTMCVCVLARVCVHSGIYWPFHDFRTKTYFSRNCDLLLHVFFLYPWSSSNNKHLLPVAYTMITTTRCHALNCYPVYAEELLKKCWPSFNLLHVHMWYLP